MNQGLVAPSVSLHGFGILDLLTGGTSVLVLLAAAVLVYRTYRERHLAVWICGWLFYLAYRVCETAGDLGVGSAALDALSQASFIIAISLFVAAVLIYTGAQRLLVPLAVAALVTVDCTIIRSFWFPDSVVFSIGIQLMFRAMTTLGAVQLLLFNRGRRELGAGLMIVMLLFLHMDQRGTAGHFLAWADIVIEVLFGLSMVVMVLDD
jgi:hypothetical protein